MQKVACLPFRLFQLEIQEEPGIMSTTVSPKCPNCLRNYSFSQAGLQPRILMCKHHLCRQCIIKLLRAKKDGVTCPRCKACTLISKDDKGLESLPVNLFLVGLACTTVKQQINPFNHQLEFKPKLKESVATTELKGGRPPCVSCHLVPAVCLCQQCNINLCNQCFTVIHSNQASKTHAKVSLLSDKVYGCSKHENLPREYFCEDDRELICARCGLMGEHKGHEILHIQEKNTDFSKEVEPAMSSAKDTLKKLYYSKKAVDAEELRLLKHKEGLRDRLEERFAEMSAELQLKFLAVQNSCMLESESRLENLCQIKNNLESNICRLTTVMEDVQSWLDNKFKAPSNLLEVVSTLRGASELPWYLTEGAKEDIKIPLQSIRDILDDVEVEKSTLHTLKSTAELPSDFEAPVIDDAILKENPLFGDKEKQTKKKKPIGPDHIRILQKEGILPTDLTGVKQRVSQDPKTEIKKTKKRQFVNVVHIKNPACFIVHRQSDGARLGKMMRSLSNICESIDDLAKHIPDPIQVGTKCCCKFDDGQWYRCMVRKVPDEVAGVLSMASPADLLLAEGDDLKVEVVYVDYGNTQWVPVTKLVKLKPKFEKEPTFAVTCALYDIIPPEQKSSWPKESSEAFAAMVATQDVPLVMSVHGDDGDTLRVDLHQSPNSYVEDDAPVSIRDALIFLELACFINDTPSPKSPKFVQTKRYLPPELPCSGDSLAVTICNIIDPHHFYVHEVGVMQSSLNKMMGELQEAYRRRDRADWAVLCPHPGMICVAKYTNDKKWYRAQITALSGKQLVEVLYVDYGNTAVIKANLIRKITEQFLKLPIMALPCKLVDIVPKGSATDSWSQEASLFFSQNISWTNMEIHVYNDQDDYMAVVAFVMTPEERLNINALMVQSGQATSSGPASFAPEMLRPSSGTSASPLATSKAVTPKQPYHCEPSSARKKTMYTAVHVSHVESPSCIYLQLATASNDGLDSLLEAMMLHYKDSEAVMDHEWAEGDPCAALLAREGVWCRGEIVTFLPENNLVVLFTDYGNKEILALQNIRSLEERFRAEPPFAICCHLTGIIPAGGKDWTQTASHFLQEKLSDLDCYISQKGEKESASLPVDLLYELTGQEMIDLNTDDELDSIAELLIKEGLALRDRSKAKLKKVTAVKKATEEKSPEVVPEPGPAGDSPVGEVEKLSPPENEAVIKPSPPSTRPASLEHENLAINGNGDIGLGDSDRSASASTTVPSPYEGTSVDGTPCSQQVGGGHRAVRDDPRDTQKVGDTQRVVDIHKDTPEVSVGSDAKAGSTKISIDSVQNVTRAGQTLPRSVGTPSKRTDASADGTDEAGMTEPALSETSSRAMSNWADQVDEELSSATPVPREVQDPASSGPRTPLKGGVQRHSPPPGEPRSPPRLPVDHVPVEYLPASLPDGGQILLAVSFVSQEGLIYGLEVEKLSVLHPLMDALQEFCKNRVHPSGPLQVNQAVCAKFNLDGKWYRATVRKILGEAVEVIYVDFGNPEVVRLEDINVRPFQIDLPQLSLCCQLHEVTTISAETSAVLAETITEQTCTTTVKGACEKGKPLIVDMFLPTGESVADLIASRGLVSWTMKPPSPPSPKTNRRPPDGGSPEEIFDDDDDFLGSGEFPEIVRDRLKESCYSPLPSRYQLLQFPLGGKEFLAEVPCIKTPDLIYLQYSTTFKDGPYQDHDLMLLYERFAALHAEVNKMALSLPEISYPRQGMPCLAFYHTDKQWYRGEIISVIEGPVLYCNVRFVDYGTIERLPVDRICQLPEKFLELPTQCRLCRLEGLRPPVVIPPGFPVFEDTRWPVASTNAMVELIKNKIFLATILEDGPIPTIRLHSCHVTQGNILRGAPMFMSLIETGLADVGAGPQDRSNRVTPSPMLH